MARQKKEVKNFTPEEIKEIAEGLAALEKVEKEIQEEKKKKAEELYVSKRGAVVATPQASDVTLPKIDKNKENSAIHRIR